MSMERRDLGVAIAPHTALSVVAGAPRAHVTCTECARCCQYVAVGINEPRRPRYASDILWYLSHPGVTVYVDGDDDWCVQFESRCRYLGPDWLCTIYSRRPHICRAFNDRSCEVNSVGKARTFRTQEEFLAYLRAERPQVYRRISKAFVPQHLQAPR
jgi:Fe-S-cluster containining protein